MGTASMAKQEDNGADASNAAASKTEDKKTESAAASAGATAHSAEKATAKPGVSTLDGIDQLKADHRKVEALFAEYEKAAPARKSAIIQETCAALILHTQLEEEIFYPACREAATDEEPLNEAQVEHDGAKVLIADLLASRAYDPYRDAKFKVLSEQVKHHVAEEEKAGSGIFAKARAAGVDTEALGEALKARKDALQTSQAKPAPTALVALEVSSLSNGQQQENSMARQQGGRDRDEQGRFTSDDRDRSRGRGDDDRSYRSRGRDDDDGRGWYGDSEGHAEAVRKGWASREGGESRSFRDDDDDRGGYRSSGRERDSQGRYASDDDRSGYGGRGRDRDDDRGYRSRGQDRDEYGRFTSDDDRDGGRYRGRSDDDRGGRDRGQGGWFGDSEGHSRAARRGWEDDDRGGRSGRGGGSDHDRDENGRFMRDDDRGGSRSRGRDDDDRGGRGSRDHGQGGWFGDSEGHARAARQRWEDDDRGGSRSRGLNEDDNDRGGRGRGRSHGGWFGDSEGHAEAARRGWEDRR